MEKVKISAIKSNPNNPRLIKDDKFHKLVKSIKEFPQMLELRPIVVNDEMVILGGNMRHKACIEAGLKEVTIVKAKEDQESQDLMKAIIMEKRKEECLNFAMKEKEKESEVKKEKAHAMTEIQRIKKEALKMLKKKRMQLKEKIVQMRRVAERKKAMLKFQLIKLRQRMAKKLVTSHHKGNMFLCPQGRDDPVKRNDYCEYHFTENYPKFLECKNDYDFCFLCCETEYGNLFPQKREECYKLCDKK